ncbi:MAG: hypothetical protein ACR2KK_12490 [Acidimicrobiales bacterium]
MGPTWRVSTAAGIANSLRDAHPAATDHGLDRGVQTALGRCPEWHTEKLAWTYLAGRVAVGPDIIAIAERTTADDPATDLGDHGWWANRLQRGEDLLEANVALAIEPPGLGVDL